jgi:hypothetical protein
MPLWDGPYLLGQFNRMAGRPESDQIANETKYLWISEAQNEVVADIASRMPEVLYPVSALPMITADGGHTFTYGNDSEGSPIFPIGKTKIYTARTAVPECPLSVGYDYLDEGNRIEIPNNRTYAGTLYWRGITPPTKIDATTPPALNPPPARELITFIAVKNFGQAGNINPDLAASMTELWSRSFPRWMLVYRTQYASGGALGPLTSSPIYSPYQYAAYLPATQAI